MDSSSSSPRQLPGRPLFLPGLLCALLLLAPALAAGTGRQAGKIHPASYTVGLRDDGRLLAWVYFTTKPSSALPKSAAPGSSPRAALRRARRSALDAGELQRLDQTVSPGYIEQVGATGATVRRVSRWLNAVSVRATPAQLRAAAEYDFVDRIEPVRRHVRRPLPGTDGGEPPRARPQAAHQFNYGNSFGQLELLNVPALHDLGYSGSGVWVLMLDTGFYQDHETVNPQRIVAQHDFLEDDSLTQNETQAEANAGQHNHGTYTYTTLGGYREGQLIGPAFACSYLLAKTESVTMEVQAEEDNYVAALEWGEALGADLVSSSLGYLDWYTYADLDGLTAVTTLGVQWATRLGMVVVTAAGNERGNAAWGGYIIAPGDADSIITVGSVSAAGNLASSSSHGPTFDGRIKPELVAQGVSVRCASPTGPDRYTSVSGTSLATPLIAGSVALLLEAHPKWGPAEVRTALMAAANRSDNPDNDYGWGIPDLLAALNSAPGDTLAESYRLAIESIFPNPFPGSVHLHTVIRWTLAEPGPVNIRVYNLLGQQVSTVHRQLVAPALGTAVWEGLDGRGRQVPSGVYFVRLESGRETAIRRVIVQR